MADNLEKKVPGSEGADEGKLDVKTLQEKYPWLNEKFIKGAKDENEAIMKAAMSQEEAEKRMHQLESEVTKIKSGGAQSLKEALTAKEDELARLKAENEALKRPPSALSAEQQSYIKNWHSRLISEDPVEAARAVQEAIAGELNLYDRRKETESLQDRLERQLEKAESSLEKEELEELLPYIEQLRKERPDLTRGRYGVEDIIDKAKIRLAEDKKAMEIEEEIKKHQKEEARTTSPEGTAGKKVEYSMEELQNMSTEEREKLLRDSGIKFV